MNQAACRLTSREVLQVVLQKWKIFTGRSVGQEIISKRKEVIFS